jgi:hypothetical protein
VARSPDTCRMVAAKAILVVPSPVYIACPTPGFVKWIFGSVPAECKMFVVLSFQPYVGLVLKILVTSVRRRTI